VSATTSSGTITVHGDYFAGCDLVDGFRATARRDGATIALTVSYETAPICSGVPSPLTYEAVIEDLPPGPYLVEVVHANDGRALSPGARVASVGVVVP
jgi:hypothetical protein